MFLNPIYVACRIEIANIPFCLFDLLSYVAIVCAVVRKLARPPSISHPQPTFHLDPERLKLFLPRKEFWRASNKHRVQRKRTIQQKIIDKGKGNNPIVCLHSQQPRGGEKEDESITKPQAAGHDWLRKHKSGLDLLSSPLPAPIYFS